MTEIRVYANRHRQICLSAREHPPCDTSSFRTMSRSSSPAADSAPRCHARHRGHTWPVSWANSSFSRVRSRKRRKKCPDPAKKFLGESPDPGKSCSARVLTQAKSCGARVLTQAKSCEARVLTQANVAPQIVPSG